MNDLELALLLDCAVRVAAFGTVQNLSCNGVDSLECSCAIEILEVWLAESLQKLSSVGLFQQDGGTVLANALQDSDGMFEEANVEYGENKLDVSVVANTICHLEVTCLAQRVLIRYTQPPIECTVGYRLSFRLANSIEISGGDLDLGHIDDVLLGQHTELDVLDLLRRILGDELLHSGE